MRFYPENITVNVGDKIVWKLKGSEPHMSHFQYQAKGFQTLSFEK